MAQRGRRADHVRMPRIVVAGGGVAGAVALVVGWPIMRLSGIGAAIATMSLLIICYIVLGNWNSLTGGQQSLMGLPASGKSTLCLAIAATTLLTLALTARAADVPHISGGVGSSERDELRTKEREYNLKVITAVKSGDYLSGAQIVIE